jgi:hypothetical protein
MKVMPDETGVSGAGQLARVENLLAAVRDLMSSLRTMSGQLEFEVLEGLRSSQRDGELAAIEGLKAENAQLKEALERRGVIERAKGVLMVACGCDEDVAFHLLVTRSRQERRKVRDVAGELVALATNGDTGRLTRLSGLHVVPGQAGPRRPSGGGHVADAPGGAE